MVKNLLLMLTVTWAGAAENLTVSKPEVPATPDHLAATTTIAFPGAKDSLLLTSDATIAGRITGPGKARLVVDGSTTTFAGWWDGAPVAAPTTTSTFAITVSSWSPPVPP